VQDVQSVGTALKLLQGVEGREWDLLGANVAKELETTISSCTQAYDLFRLELQRWTRHSEDGKLAWRDRTNVGFFKQAQTKAMSDQLQSCKLTINFIISIAIL
jgi:orotate phosphoribosyltransferase-like protein